ncbi:MAG: leucine-rich repeat domain-containing protein [Candidatus Lokiarchaeota archaeon]|nr:leucine-rich repeat domain-containing protein [Candidatus Lokiarchaeota archaeon]
MSEDMFIIEDLEKITGVTFKRIAMPYYTIVSNWYMKDNEDRVVALSVDLAELNLNSEKLKLFGESIKKLSFIDKLLLKLPESGLFPEWCVKFKNIKSLIVKDSHLTRFPELFRQFKNLEVLNLEGNDLKSLPDWFAELDKITELNLSNNKFDQLPDLLTMAYLKKLDIESPTPLSDLTEETLNKIAELLKKGVEINSWLVKALFELKVSKEQVKVLSNIRNEAGKNVVRIDLMDSKDDQYTINGQARFNYYQCVHARVWDGKIRQITANEYNLVNLPKDLAKIESLEYLSLRGNKLRTLPDTFGKLVNLKDLDLSDNALSSLPDSFSDLKSLVKLNLNKNQFVEIPTELWAVKELVELNMNDNPLTSEEIIVSQKVPDLIRKHLRKKATIKVFISHAVVDFEKYRVAELSEFLEHQKEISQVFFCEENLAGNIDQWMLEAVQKCHLVLFIATYKSVFDSPDCDNELKLADKFSIPVIPIKGEDVEWFDLAEKNLSRELGLEFDGKNFEDFSENLYKYIENVKREINLLEKEERRSGVVDVYERFRLIMDDKLREFDKKIERKLREITKDFNEKIGELEKKIDYLTFKNMQGSSDLQERISELKKRLLGP